MRKSLLVFVLSAACCLGAGAVEKIPENQSVTAALRSTYKYAFYNEYGWYHITTADGLDGLADANGNIVFTPGHYDHLYFYPDSKMITFRKNKGDDTNGLMKVDGTVVIPQGRYNSIYPNKVWIEVNNGNSARGACDINGKEIVPAKYDYVGLQNDAYYAVKTAGKYGMYRSDGKQIVGDGMYDLIEAVKYFGEDRIRIKNAATWGLLDTDGKVIIPCEYESIREFEKKENSNMLLLKKIAYGGNAPKTLVGLADLDGKIVVPCEYDDDIIPFRNILKDGVAPVKKSGKTGVVDIKGSVIVPTLYELAVIGNDYIRVYDKQDKQGIYSLDGVELLPCGFDFIGSGKSKNLFVTIKGAKCLPGGKFDGGQYGLYDLTARKQLLDEPYDFVGQTEEDLRVASCRGKWGYIDSVGSVVVPFEYDKATPFKKGVAQVQKDGQSIVLPHPSKGTKLTVASAGVSIPVDRNIPAGKRKRENTFAVIISCENYPSFNADYAVNDGRIFKEYCVKTLGIPESNVRMAENCSLGNLLKTLADLEDIADVYEGEAEILFYFAGVGTKAEADGTPLMLLCDSELATAGSSGYSLDALAARLGKLPARYVFAAVDAPFNGTGRDGKPLGEGRGVRLKAKTAAEPGGSLVMLAAAADGGDAMSHPSLGHGILTYGLLEYLQANPDADSLDAWTDHAVKAAAKRSLELTQKVQKPSLVSSPNINQQTRY